MKLCNACMFKFTWTTAPGVCYIRAVGSQNKGDVIPVPQSTVGLCQRLVQQFHYELYHHLTDHNTAQLH